MSFEEYLSALDSDIFEEKPVPLKEFLYSEDYMNLPPLSPVQERVVEAMTVIYDYDDMESLWGKEEADKLENANFREIILVLGKSSGKDYLTSIAFARIIYLLLCLREPAAYFGKPPGDNIAIINVAINSDQAKNVFFKYLKTRIKRCKWFQGKHDQPTAEKIQFDKEITVFSGHSRRESFEGYNFLLCCLDEIDGFESEEESKTTRSARADTADAVYNTYRATLNSRFPRHGKLVLLSWPRMKSGFLMTRYNEVVADVNTVVKSHTFKLNTDLPDGDERNEFTVSWEEDHIVRYAEPDVYALRRATWEVNPLNTIEDFKRDFFRNPADALMRYAAMPSDSIDGWFKDKQKLEKAFPDTRPGPFDENWVMDFTPKNRNYYAHIDLGQKYDRAVATLCHVEDWVTIRYSKDVSATVPIIELDAVRYWTPRTNQDVPMTDVKQYIRNLKLAGCRIKQLTMDRWQSAMMMEEFNQMGIPAERLSLTKAHYDDLMSVLMEERLRGYGVGIIHDDANLAVRELSQLQLVKANKIDHPKSGSSDIADAICGAVYNAITLEEFDNEIEVEVRYLGVEEERSIAREEEKRQMPPELRQFMEDMKVI